MTSIETRDRRLCDLLLDWHERYINHTNFSSGPSQTQPQRHLHTSQGKQASKPKMASQPTSTTGNSWHSPKAQGQTSWDVKDPALDAESKAEWGIPPPRAIIKKSQTSYEWCMERKEKILAGHSSKSSTRVFVL